jgi:hypothetical protein
MQCSGVQFSGELEIEDKLEVESQNNIRPELHHTRNHRKKEEKHQSAVRTCLYLSVEYRVPKFPGFEGSPRLALAHIAFEQCLKLFATAIIKPCMSCCAVRMSGFG